MKYIDSEKLKAEIERLHKAHFGKYGCDEVAINLEYLEDFITSLQQDHLPDAGKMVEPEHIADVSKMIEQPKSTCKTCGFYENNCPFIRGKLIPYPNKVCKDYIYLAIKEKAEVDLEKLGEIARHLIAVKQNVEDMRLSEDEWSLLERIGYPQKLNARKEE